MFCVYIDGDVSAPLLDLPTHVHLFIIFAIVMNDVVILMRLLNRQDESRLVPRHGTQQASIHHHQYTPLLYRKKSLMYRNYIPQIQISIRIRIPIQRRTLGLQLAAVWREELKRDLLQRVSRYTHQARVLRKGVQVELRRSPRRMSLLHNWCCSLFELLTAAAFGRCNDFLNS
jgi:hypothetical protein